MTAVSESRKVRVLAKSAVKRQKILDAAARTFRTKGYANATLGEIAKEAGTQAGSLYYYFSSREDLVEQVLEVSMRRTADHVAEAIDALPETATPVMRIEVAIRAHLESILISDDYLVAYQKIIDQIPEDIHRRFVSLPRSYARYWDQLLADAQKSNDIRTDLDPGLIRLILLGAVSWTLEWYKPGGRRKPFEIADHVVRIFFDGIIVKSEGSSATVLPVTDHSPRPQAANG